MSHTSWWAEEPSWVQRVAFAAAIVRGPRVPWRTRRKAASMGSSVIPAFRYRDARAAIDFLVEAFGFEPKLVVEGDDGSIEHAQLQHGTGMVMLGSIRDDEYGRLLAHGDRVVPSGAVYVVVPDVHAHAEHARAAGAEIVTEPEEQDYGGADYTARDPEGVIWSFGSYDPWADQSGE